VNVAEKKSQVTAIVTGYKHESFIRECLDSILHQTICPEKLIIVDDCSNDRTEAVCLDWYKESKPSFEVVFIFHDVNVGICKSLNEALTQIETKYYFHISADDWVEPQRIETQLSAAESTDDSTSLVISSIREVDINGDTIVDHDFGKKLAEYSEREIDGALHSKLLAENVIPAPAVFIRTDWAKKIGGYDESLAFEDYDMWLRLSRVSKIKYVNGIVSNYRILNTSMLRNKQRYVDLKMSEAKMLVKHQGQGVENDKIIYSRLIGIKQEIVNKGVKRGSIRLINKMLKEIPQNRNSEANK
jgi:glycosyltransferase involved in cell wall biosynthesis